MVCRVKYCNSLPDIPFDPKFITYPFDQNRYGGGGHPTEPPPPPIRAVKWGGSGILGVFPRVCAGRGEVSGGYSTKGVGRGGLRVSIGGLGGAWDVFGGVIQR